MTHHEERFHLILMLYGNLLDIQYTCVSTSLDAAMLLNSLEDLPSVVAVARVGRETVGDEERLHE